MDKSRQQGYVTFNTEPWYAIFSGFLILPFISTILSFLGAIIMVTNVNPRTLDGFDAAFYWLDAVSLPLLVIIYLLWWMRKRYFPYVIMVFFAIHATIYIVLLITDELNDFFSIVMNIVWMIYFLRSKRVKATFTN